VNFDGPDSDGVRDYFLQNALRWLEEFHIDALRLDAVHAIFDFSAYPFLEELSDEVRALGQNLGRPLHLIAESDLNDTRIIRSKEEGGFALDAQWSDDFHHALHSLITGERDGYYEDFGDLEKLQQVLQRGFAYGGEYSRHRKRRHGNDSSRCPAKQFVVCIQNHDQVGNRMLGERMTSLANFEQRKLAAVAVILSPFQPLLFMGEEYGETAPFLFFVSHGDPDLVDAVRKGRREEFSAFSWKGEAPDPQSEETFRKSILDHTLREKGEHAHLYKLYRDLLSLRRDHPVLRVQEKGGVSADSEKRILVRRVGSDGGLVIVHNFSDASQDIGGTVSTNGKVLINTASSRFGGPDKNQKETLQTIAPHSALVIETGK
jgi:maltooligosyltrehalose trehalohydrolase